MSVAFEEYIDSQLSQDCKTVIHRVAEVAEQENIKIYIIGGIVRDLILHNAIKDIDIVVESDAIDFCKSLENSLECEIISTQENLRTAKVLFSNNIEIDFASTREEKYEKSGVLPVAYNFGCSLKKDIMRRDFTINTLAISLTGENKYSIVDYCGGYDDVLNKRIRVLHNKSFIDDPSRIIRALKFQVRFDFEIEENTNDLLKQYLDNVDYSMPLERIKSELKQYFSIEKKGLYSKIIDTKAYKLISDNPFINFDENFFKNLDLNYLYNKDELWFVYIVLLIVNSDIAYERLNMTAFEKKIIKEVQELLLLYPLNIEDKKFLYKTFNDRVDLSILIYYVMTKDKAVKYFYDVLKEIKVLITGKDLIELGFIPSSYFNELFEKVLNEKLEGNLKTKKEEIDFVKQFIKK